MVESISELLKDCAKCVVGGYAWGLKDSVYKNYSSESNYNIAWYGCDISNESHQFAIEACSESAAQKAFGTRRTDTFQQRLMDLNKAEIGLLVRGKVAAYKTVIRKEEKKSFFRTKLLEHKEYELQTLALNTFSKFESSDPIYYCIIAHPATFMNSGRKAHSILTYFLGPKHEVKLISDALQSYSKNPETIKVFLAKLFERSGNGSRAYNELLVTAKEFVFK